MENIEQLIAQATFNHQNGNLIQAERLYLQALELFPFHDNVYNFLGIIYTQMNNYEQAIIYLKKSIELKPNKSNYYINLGEALLKKGDINEAIHIFYKSINLSPDFPDSHFNMANALKINKNYQGAIEHYKKAIFLNPSYASAFNNLGLTYIEHSLFKEAVSAFNNVIKIDPDFPNIKDNLSIALRMMGENIKRINNSKLLDTFSDIEKKYDDNDLISSYLNLLKKCLTDTLRIKDDTNEYNRIKEGLDWPIYAETMIGIKRLNNLHYCLSEVIKNNIPGDFIETGVWRGGATIFMSGFLNAYGIKNRNVWVADSFEGLPPPNMKYIHDLNSNFHKMQPLKVSIEDVKDNFKKYNLLNENVKFLKGWFKDTLHIAPIENIAVLRLDGDMYESTIDTLVSLYPKLSVGGYIIVDDYNAVAACRNAVEDYRNQHNITEEIYKIDTCGVYWKKEI